MEEIKKMRSLVNTAQREERKANNDMANFKQQASQEQEQLDACLRYKQECLYGLKTAKESGLSIVQIRECQLLVKYLDSVVETRQYKADVSQENYDKAKTDWQVKHDSFKELKDTLKKLEKENSERMVGDDASNDNGTFKEYRRK